jgi:hypothetical protein
MQRSNGELHLVSALHTFGNASGNFALPESAAVSAFLGEAKQAADGIVTYDYSTKVARCLPTRNR